MIVTMDKSTTRRTDLKFPKLKAGTELLQALPSLKKYFPDQEAPKGTSPHSPAASKRRDANPSAGYDSDEDKKEACRAASELAKAKQERANLLKALVSVRQGAGQSGGDLQTADIAALRQSLGQKQRLLDELRDRNAGLGQTVQSLEIESRDCQCLLPEEGGDPASAQRASVLLFELKSLDNSTKEVESRNDQYRLLQERTAGDRLQAERRMRAAREAKDSAAEDVHTLTQHFHETQAAKEEAERALGASVTQLDQVRADWQRKLRDKRKEVKQMERRLADEAAEAAAQEVAAAQRTQQAELERADEMKKKQTLRAEAWSPAAVERLQAAEALWARVRSLSGGSTPQDIVAAWQELNDRATALNEILRLTREAEERMRSELAQSTATEEHPHNVSASDADESNESTANSSAEAAAGAQLLGESASSIRKTPAQRVRRMEQLCAAAEGSLSALLDRLSTAVNMHDDMQRMAKVKAAEEQAHHAQHADHRKSRRSITAMLRRASVLPPRRVSAVDLAHARGAPGADRRGSIEMLIQTGIETEVVVSTDLEGDPSAAADAETAVHSTASSTNNTHHSTFFPELPGLLHKLRSKAEELLKAEHYHIEDYRGRAHESSPTPSVKKGFSRTTMAGPAWVDPPTATGQPATTPTGVRLVAVQCDILEAATPSSPIQTHTETEQQGSELTGIDRTYAHATTNNHKDKDLAVQQAVKANQAVQVERYLQRLADATVDVKARQSSNPFTLESSDEDDQPVMDRGAVKHRSYKITHPKQPKSPRGGRQGGARGAASPQTKKGLLTP